MFAAVLQARMTCTRMPGKVMAPLAGEPMIWRQIERLRRCRGLSRIIVATSTETSDDALAGYLVSRGVSVFRGSPTDLLDRFARCAAALGSATHIVCVKGDCPLIDEAVRLAQVSGATYVSNRNPQRHPRGLEVEVITTSALIKAAALPRDVTAPLSPTAYICTHPKQFPAFRMASPSRDLSGWDWRIKTPVDLAFIKGVYDALHDADPDFGMGEVLDLMARRNDLARVAA